MIIPRAKSCIRQPPQTLLLSRRQILQGAAALAAVSLLPGCGSSSTASGAATNSNSTVQPKPSGAISNASLSVTTGIAGSIGPAFAGLSYEKGMLNQNPRLFTATNSNLIGMFKRIGPSLLRIGGNSVDKNVWTPNGPGQTSGQIAPSDVDAVAAFVKAAGWQCLYGVNLGGSATGATTPALAAQEVAYAAQQFGTSLLGIEIGNEPDLYGNTGHYYSGNWSLAQFITLWEQFRTAILAATPGVAVTGPADASHASTWTVPFGQTVTRNQITLLTQHYYRANGQSPTSTVEYLITPDSTLVSELATLKASAHDIGVPYRMAECNSFYNGGAPNISDSYASSLWVVDYLFDCALGGSTGANFHGGGDGSGYTPIANSGGSVVEARPEFYGILFFTLAGQGTLNTTQLSAGGLNVTAYAVKTSSGGLNLVVNNKDSTQNLHLTINLPQEASSATLIAMTQLSQGASGPSLSATSGVTIQGASIGADGSFSPDPAYALNPSGMQLQCYVPILSAVLIQIT